MAFYDTREFGPPPRLWPCGVFRYRIIVFDIAAMLRLLCLKWRRVASPRIVVDGRTSVVTAGSHQEIEFKLPDKMKKILIKNSLF